ncbi:GNAT family N-acetyltransferase, partial [Candidatus Poribacteria bacterium]|nr:GNAT family N-acetyltransferase [Candidatus Poribacteria bacterium]
MQVILKNGRAITMRLKTSNDGEALGEMLANCSERTYHFFHPYPLTRESGLKIAADANIICFIAFADDGATVGYIWIGREILNLQVPTLGICVRDGWQGLGGGRALMERILAEAKTLGKKGIQL